MLSSCRVLTSTVMSSTADFVFSIENLVLDKLNEFSIILHYKFTFIYLYTFHKQLLSQPVSTVAIIQVGLIHQKLFSIAKN